MTVLILNFRQNLSNINFHGQCSYCQHLQMVNPWSRISVTAATRFDHTHMTDIFSGVGTEISNNQRLSYPIEALLFIHFSGVSTYCWLVTIWLLHCSSVLIGSAILPCLNAGILYLFSTNDSSFFFMLWPPCLCISIASLQPTKVLPSRRTGPEYLQL